jgi:small conductance mechanosensitive channel
MSVDDIRYWARGEGLEILLIVIGAVLVARGLRWTFQGLVHPGGSVPPSDLPEEARYRKALLQAASRACIAVVWFFAVVMVVSRLNVPVAAVVAPATLIGAAVGFGAQRVVADFLSGYFLLVERQFGYGDEVQIAPPGQTDGVSGTVEELTLRYTRLRLPGGDLLIVPNGEIRQVLARSRRWSRVDVTVPVDRACDVDQAMERLRESMGDLSREPRWRPWLPSPPAVRGVACLGLERLDVHISARTRPEQRDDLANEIRRRAAHLIEVSA